MMQILALTVRGLSGPCSNVQRDIPRSKLTRDHRAASTNQTPIRASRAVLKSQDYSRREPSTVIHLSLSRSRVLDHCQLPSIEPSRARATPFSFRPTRNALPISSFLSFFFGFSIRSFFAFSFFTGFRNGVCRTIVKQFVGRKMIGTVYSCVSRKCLFLGNFSVQIFSCVCNVLYRAIKTHELLFIYFTKSHSNHCTAINS